MTIFTSLKRFDAYTKPVEDFRERTVTGLDLKLLLLLFSQGQTFLLQSGTICLQSLSKEGLNISA